MSATKVKSLVFAFFFLALSPAVCAEQMHLFILSGQSNMKYLDPAESFVPIVAAELGPENVIVVHHAKPGESLTYWCGTCAVYERMMEKVEAAIEGKDIASATLCWMQGERDAFEMNAAVYADNFERLLGRIANALGREYINFVIGRINDCLPAINYPNKDVLLHWNRIREIQVDLAESSANGKWIDTDDLNGPRNSLHMTRGGYRKLGERFAIAAIGLIRDSP